ncbi:hypothetical protein [Pseudomonas corrugata]|uniref:hypothetical protein n=1 Tax=Pseudomonas corrugata TaxID=47879 RepID=UPI0006D8AFA4|nr:hypothetical protein [Pseudomonas corrugata]
MHRIDGPGATVDNKFTEGDPVSAVPATVVTDDWLNAVQEEVVAVIASAGLTLNKANNAQLLAAITQKISNAIPASPPDASTTVKGLVELATATETAAGTDTTRAVTPDGLALRLSVFLPTGYISGLRMWNSPGSPTTVVNVDPGAAKSSDGLSDIVLSANFAAGLISSGSWTAGSGAQKLDTGARAANTWYHLFLIRKTSDGSAELLFSTSATAPTMPTGYAGFRLIDSVLTDGSGLIIPFINVIGSAGIRTMYWSTAVRDATVSGAASPVSTSLALSTPAGRRVMAKTNACIQSNNPCLILSPTDTTSVTVGVAIGSYLGGVLIGSNDTSEASAAEVNVMTDTSRQVRVQAASAASTIAYSIVTVGWQTI